MNVLNLKNISVKQFEKQFLYDYEKLFPYTERKSIDLLQEIEDKGMLNIIQLEESQTIGFMICIYEPNSPYMLLDYFAILPEFQSKGYGSEAIKMLQKKFENEKYILIEIEDIDKAVTEDEKIIRQKRANFYERLQFKKLDFEIDLFSVHLTPYIYYDKYENIEKDNLEKVFLELYYKIYGRKNVNVISVDKKTIKITS